MSDEIGLDVGGTGGGGKDLEEVNGGFGSGAKPTAAFSPTDVRDEPLTEVAVARGTTGGGGSRLLLGLPTKSVSGEAEPEGVEGVKSEVGAAVCDTEVDGCC